MLYNFNNTVIRYNLYHHEISSEILKFLIWMLYKCTSVRKMYKCTIMLYNYVRLCQMYIILTSIRPADKKSTTAEMKPYEKYNCRRCNERK
jgi:hypothetical protein